MKRIAALFLTLVLLLAFNTAFANPIEIKGLNEKKLYELYSEVQSKIQLDQLKKKANYLPVNDYKDFERNPSKHKDEYIYFEGTVIQVIEDQEYRIAVDKKGDQIFLVSYTVPEDSERFLEDDKVAVYARFKELYTYKSTTNLSVTVPYCSASLMIHPVNNNNVKNATAEELETAVSDIRAQLDKTAAKDHDYKKLTKANYNFYAKNPGLYKGDQITFTGKALQVVDGSVNTTIRVSVDNDSDKVVYLTMPNNLTTIRILEDDNIVVKGSFTGLYTYSSTMGGQITIPACTAESVNVKGYNAPKNIPKDKEGNSKVTKQVFGDYSRRPNEHTDEKITFSAKVVQVIEGDDHSEYRMAVDNDNNSIIFVNLPNDYRTMRVLEDDKVTVIGTFGGLLTYQSTFGAAITIPKCIATSVVIPGKKATIAAKNADGKYKVNKENYESFARDEETYKTQPLTFSAEVVQVSEDDGFTIYRLAVDKSYDAMFLGIAADSTLNIRILEGDMVTVEATSTGLYSYNSTRGGKITIPSCMIDSYTVQNYKKVELGEPDSNGNYRINKKNYDEIARNPKPYTLKGMTFKGRVLQVVEGKGGENVYRVAVDGDSNCAFYIEYTLPAGSSRILEKDNVTVTGTYYGIYTYTTTMGSSVSVPALIATDMKR